MSVTTKLRKSANGRLRTPVVRLVEEIERLVAKHDSLVLSRWESHYGNHCRVTYAVHYGTRTRTSDKLAPGMTIAKVELTAPEGQGEQSEAFRELIKLRNFLRTYRP